MFIECLSSTDLKSWVFPDITRETLYIRNSVTVSTVGLLLLVDGFISLVSSRDLINSLCLKSVWLISYLTRFRTLCFLLHTFPENPEVLIFFKNTSII